jgi:hypothetical protein
MHLERSLWLGKGVDRILRGCDEGGSSKVIHGTTATKIYGQELILIVFMV